MKKIIICTVLSLVLCFCFGYTVFFANIDNYAFALADNINENSENSKSNRIGINAPSYVLADYDTGEILAEKNSNNKLPIASITKLMTLLVAYDAINQGKCTLDDSVKVSTNASSMGGSQAFLEANSTHKFKDLIKTIIIASANDSCVAIAEHISGSVTEFVSQMNKKASELNLTATNFVNCTGLPALNQYSCASDCVKMLCALIKQENNYFEYSKIWLEDYVHPDGRITTLTNTNKLVRFFDGCDGGKTGFTNESKHCLCATAKRGDTRFIACVLGENDSKIRFADVSAMLNYGFANYVNDIKLDTNGLDDLKVIGGKQSTIKVVAEHKLTHLSKKGQNDNSSFEVVLEVPPVKAPITENQILGVAYLIKDGQIIDKTNILAAESIERKSYFDSVQEIIRQW